MSTLLIPACLIGCVFTGIWGLTYNEEDENFNKIRTFAILILTGIILVFLVDIALMYTISSHGKYFGVVIGRKGRRTFVASSSGGGNRSNESGMVIQNNVNVFSTDSQRQNVNQLQQQNRLLQQQVALQQQLISQQQQQQQQFSGGMYPPPPPTYSNIDPAYPPTASFPDPSAPPPPYAKAM